MVGVAELSGPPTHAVIADVLQAITCMEHRGGCLEGTGDGAGILLRPEREFFARFVAPGRRLGPDDPLIVGCVFFLPGERNTRALQREVDQHLRREGLSPLGWREVPTDPSVLGEQARSDVPVIHQVLVGAGHRLESQLDEALQLVRRRVEDGLAGRVAVPSLNRHTLVYKALATGAQLGGFFPDLRDPALTTRVAIGHRRFSTNTFSNWHLVQPFRLLAHNGEINTIRANTRAVRDVERALGVSKVLLPNGSDSAQLDRAVELVASKIARGGLPEALRRLVPPVWRGAVGADEHTFFAANQRVLGTLGAWDGPAGLVASDGRTLVALLDRMGLRPLRWFQLDTGRVVVSSEAGAIPCDPARILRDGQLEPGAMLVADLQVGQLVTPDASTRWIMERADSELAFGDLDVGALVPLERKETPQELPDRTLNAFGWNRTRLQRLKQMCKTGKEVVHSMGNDRPLGVFNEDHPRLFSFLNQIVAVVTNPPIDPLREGRAMDLTCYLGCSPRLDAGGPTLSNQVALPHPVLTTPQTRALIASQQAGLGAHVLDATFADSGDARALTRRFHELADEALEAVCIDDVSLLVISDRRAAEDGRLPMPTLLVVGALHRLLAAAGQRRAVSLIIETGEVYEGHDLAVLLAYGATAVNPYATLALARDVRGVEPDEAERAVVSALVATLERVMAKMGITTIEGYRGSALFEAVALAPDVVDYFLPGTESNLGGIGLDELYADIVGRAQHDDGLSRPPDVRVFDKQATRALQLVARNGNADGEYDQLVELLRAKPPVYLRDLLELQVPAEAQPIEPVPTGEIVRAAFRGAAMSHGALHATAHRAIAAAFNQLGARSNSGEGGEDPRRNPGGEWEADRNRVRQVASGRFGVDAAYLTGADELEIKIGQGAKPGEGGFLPGHKVNAEIAAIRKTQIGVPLISPPPHHDIYSIEDLAQLIRNLRQVNPKATIGVKVPSVTGLGTIAVGIAKAGADVITVSGCMGGTGAAYSGSIFHAGLPLERGLTEAHQYLLANGLRDRLRLCADGGIKFGDDVVKALALGADCVGFGTALLVAENCVFCRGCNHGKCPVGITTQDPKRQETWMTKHNPELKETSLDQRYVEARDGVVRYLTCVAVHVRDTLRQLGFTHPRELVGRVDLLRQLETGNPRWDRLDLSELLLDVRPDPTRPAAGPTTEPVRDGVSRLNADLLARTRAALEVDRRAAVELDVDLVPGQSEAVGATLAGALARGEVDAERVRIRARGWAGQGFGFAACSGMTLHLEGYANDAVAEVISGDAQVVVVPPAERGAPSPVHLAGNAAAYGATGGELFVAGLAGQRFGVRNSGATLVAEGVGEYAFEYMTGGVGLVLGPCGGNVGSGLTGGEVVVYDPLEQLAERVHPDAAIVADVSVERLAGLRTLLERYVETTGSRLAADLLGDWDQAQAHVRWVAPAAGELPADSALLPGTSLPLAAG